MNLIIIHRYKNSAATSGDSLFRFAISSEPIAGLVLDGLGKSLHCGHNSKIVCAIPKEWSVEHRLITPEVISYTENVPICSEALRKNKRKRNRNSWFVVSNGRFATQINSELLDKALARIQADVVAVNVEPELLAYHEKVRLTIQGKIAGFRRLYSDSAEPAPIPADWPHHLFVKTNVLDKIFAGHTLPQSFSELTERCFSNSLTFRAINVAGAVTDLETERGLLSFCSIGLDKIRPTLPARRKAGWAGEIQNLSDDSQDSNIISSDARFTGNVLLGKNIHVGSKVTVIGPAIIGDNVKVETGAVIKSSIIGPKVRIPKNQLIQNCVVKGQQRNWNNPGRFKSNSLVLRSEGASGLRGRSSPCVARYGGRSKVGGVGLLLPPSVAELLRRTGRRVTSKQICYPKFDLYQQHTNNTFCDWPRFSYARCFKRIADILAAVIVLILFASVMPFIALAIKLNSPGTVFFKDKRQTRHGKEFCCLKFRTMTVGADKIQDKLRTVSQVDGPQFKIADDPRISAVGRFLRDTYIDEIPQFFNVLSGQMSVVGPRPSPEAENTLCPSWRDARLSVRPGITGLWQICRTRQPMKDFQEWIHYDTRYVRNLSLRMDLWICWQTTKKLVKNFVGRF